MHITREIQKEFRFFKISHTHTHTEGKREEGRERDFVFVFFSKVKMEYSL